MGGINSICSDFSENRHECILCRRVLSLCRKSRLVRCTWLPKRKINVKLAQQKLF
jgi:hypothetical protein